MAFDTDPIVDESSSASEDSVNAVKRWFTQRRGFICREEHPDKGTDINVELIDIEKGSNNGSKFPIQIKSAQNPSKVSKKSKEYISYKVKTSRLGYFSRIPPTYGLFILYDVKSENIYYDFTERIIERLDEQHQGNWKEKEEVMINFPVDNLLSEDHVKSIYNIISRRFENHSLLIHENGSKYQIPSFREFSHANLSIENIIERVDKSKFGYLLLNERQFNVLEIILRKASKDQIESSPTLLLLAFITYCELGKGIDAQYYLKKVKRQKEKYDDFEKELFVVYELKIRYIFGEISTDEYILGLESIKKLTEINTNRISLLTNIINLKLLSASQKSNLEWDVEKEILDFLKEIDLNTEVTESDRHSQKVYLTDSLHFFTTKLFIDIGTVVKTQRLLGVKPNYRQNDAQKIVPLKDLVKQILRNAYKFALENNNKLLIAEASYRLGWFFTQEQVDLMLLQQLTQEKVFDSLYTEAYNFLARAINIFREMGYVIDCQKALLKLYELKTIYSFFKNKLLGNESFEFILDKLETLEEDNGIPHLEPVVNNIIETFYKNKKKLVDYSEDDILIFAGQLMEMWNLPDVCYVHLYNNIKDRVYFEQHNKVNRYLLFEKKSENRIIMYSRPITYILKDVHTELVSLENTDVKLLMKQFGII